MHKEKLSIVIPSYNRSNTIGRTLDSFIAQDYKNWEMLVVDDHSTDNTEEVIKAYHQRDDRIHYLLNERKKGAQGARNTGILHANYDWICLFDSDDVALPDFLSKMVSLVNNDIDVVTCDVNAVYLDGTGIKKMYWGGKDYIEKKLMTLETYIGMDMTLIRKKSLFEIGLLDENCCAYQEFDTHLRLSRICKYAHIDEPLVEWFVGGADTITRKTKMNRNARCYVIWHNRKRWREISYKSLIHEAKSLFAKTQLKYRWYLIKAVPEILLLLPIVYINIVIRFINRRFNKSIPQL